MEQNSDEITISQKRSYSIWQKIFCCRCFPCFQRRYILKTDMRQQTLNKMIRKYMQTDDNDDHLFDPIRLMLLIYLCTDQKIPQNHIEKCRLSPNVGIQTYRTDLQFYIPQMCNFLVFNAQLSQNYLMHSLQKASQICFYFGHRYYFYISSLTSIITKDEIQTLKKVINYKKQYLEQICQQYQKRGLTSVQYYMNKKIPKQCQDRNIQKVIKLYGTTPQETLYCDRTIIAKDISLPIYTQTFKKQQQSQHVFKSTLNFFQDLFEISSELKTYYDKKQKLKELLMIVNRKLPANVYIPFSKKSIRLYNVLNILPHQCRVFSTKQRTPYYICVEVYCPSEILDKEGQDKFLQQIQTPQTLKNNFYLQNTMSRRSFIRQYKSNISSISHPPVKRNYPVTFNDPFSSSMQTQRSSISSNQQKKLNKKLLEQQPIQYPQIEQEIVRYPVIQRQITRSKLIRQLKQVFGQSQKQHYQKIRIRSIYGQLSTWDLVHFIVKTGDNLKQQQFALQLIYQFDYIFKLEKLPLLLTPYQVISMNPDSGIIQMVKDSVTIDSLKKKINQLVTKQQATLANFFQLIFHDNLVQAKQLFVRSLAAYSLVMYFLQVKDRHNGNILIHRSGKIFHIDYGFFLSNMPGKGIQLQRDVPFKLISQYVNVLDGPQSTYFKKFRQYLFYGFKAARKHQNKILILIKMMYSSSGTTMPCFEKGQDSIRALQNRFNPPDVDNDASLNLHCQQLINNSLDNWAAKWYDRWQYWSQGILY